MHNRKGACSATWRQPGATNALQCDKRFFLHSYCPLLHLLRPGCRVFWILTVQICIYCFQAVLFLHCYCPGLHLFASRLSCHLHCYCQDLHPAVLLSGHIMKTPQGPSVGTCGGRDRTTYLLSCCQMFGVSLTLLCCHHCWFSCEAVQKVMQSQGMFVDWEHT